MPATIRSGNPGERWLNDTGDVWWQLVCSLSNTCGFCFQFHHEIAEYWATPFHRCCACEQYAVPPGDYAEPFADYRRLLRGMDAAQRTAAVGQSNWRLIARGIVVWDDVVTDGFIRSLAEVAKTKKLTVAAMVAAGVAAQVAKRAWDASHKPMEELIAARVERRHAAIQKSGLTDAQLKTGLHVPGKIVASGTSLDLGPSIDASIVAATAIITRLHAGASGPPPGFPDFHGSVTAMRDWVARSFPQMARILTDTDWAVLLIIVEEQARLKRQLKRLGEDPQRAIEAIQ